MIERSGRLGRTTRAFSGAAVIACAGLLVGSTGVLAQQPPRVVPKKDKDKAPVAQPKANQPTAAPAKSFLEGVLKKGRSHEWVQRVSIHLDSYQDTNTYNLPPGAQPPPPPPPGQGKELTIIPFKFTSAAVVFPAIKSTSTSELRSEVSAVLKFDNRIVDTTATFIDDLACGARYAKWDMGPQEGRSVDLDVELPVNTWEVKFDEALAAKAVWPKSGRWPREAQTALGPQRGIDVASPLLQQALNKWCDGKPPQSIPPVQLAKFLASKVIETLQPSGDGLVSSKTGLLQGFYLRGAELTLQEGRGSDHDIAGVLCALYRAAGLPARIVIGYDVSESKGDALGLKRKRGGDIRSWVEFCVIDETVKGTDGGPARLWIPVDVVAQRKSSSRPPPLGQPWKFFGNNEDAESVIPIAFHFHPDILAGVVAHGSACFWGWITMPERQIGEQMVRFSTITASKTAPRPGGGGNR